MIIKPFKVASISENSNSFGLFGHIMRAEDGEAWQVGRVRAGNYPEPWERGQVVEVPLMTDPVRGITRPAWEELHCEVPQRMADAPEAVVAEVWGKSHPAADEPMIASPEVEPSVTFSADQFTATQWQTPQDKADFATAFVRFVENGFQERHFPDWFYRRLSQTFGHIAHFDRTTFYRTFFGNAEGKARFLRQTVEHAPVGDPAFTYSDVERALRQWVLDRKLSQRFEKSAEHARNRVEREQLKRLLEKHGLPDDHGKDGP